MQHKKQQNKKNNTPKQKKQSTIHLYSSFVFPRVFYIFEGPGHQVTCERKNGKNKKKQKQTHTMYVRFFPSCFVFFWFFSK
jgi:hypothetical protein